MKTKNILFSLYLSFSVILVSTSFSAQAATDAILSLSASETEIELNDNTDITILVNTGSNDNVTTVESYITFDPTMLELQGNVDTSSSSFPLVFRNNTSTSGLLQISLSNTEPQDGSDVAVASFTMKGIQEGTTEISFDPDHVAVLINDRDNTNVLSSTEPVTITIGSGSSSSSSGGPSSGSSSGSGSSGSSSGNSTAYSHYACVNNSCMRVAGRGDDECSTDANCLATNNGNTNDNSSIGGSDEQCKAPEGVRGERVDNNITLYWNNTDSRVSGFDIYYGTEAGNYPQTEHTGNRNVFTIDNVTQNETYYIALKSMGSDCLLSDYSNEISISPNQEPTSSNTGNSGAASVISNNSGLHAAAPKNLSKTGVAFVIPSLLGIAGGYLLRKKYTKRKK